MSTFTRSPSEESTSLPHIEHTGLLIGGRGRPAASGATFPVDDPATSAVIAEVANAAPQHAEDAVAAAPAVAANWAGAPPREPSEILRSTWQLMVDRADDLTALITLETARPRPTRDRRSATPGVHRSPYLAASW
jgi:succinate-semialdehyde dehydrogenase / glutarate-semialdehyde dehydrogenase